MQLYISGCGCFQWQVINFLVFQYQRKNSIANSYHTTIANVQHHKHCKCSSHHQIVIWICFWFDKLNQSANTEAAMLSFLSLLASKVSPCPQCSVIFHRKTSDFEFLGFPQENMEIWGFEGQRRLWNNYGGFRQWRSVWNGVGESFSNSALRFELIAENIFCFTFQL